RYARVVARPDDGARQRHAVRVERHRDELRRLSHTQHHGPGAHRHRRDGDMVFGAGAGGARAQGHENSGAQSPHPLSPSPHMRRGGTTDGLSLPSPEGRGDQRGEDRSADATYHSRHPPTGDAAMDLWTILAWVGRIGFAAFFVKAGVGHFTNAKGITGYAQSKGVTAAALGVPMSGSMLFAGGQLFLFQWLEFVGASMSSCVLV